MISCTSVVLDDMSSQYIQGELNVSENNPYLELGSISALDLISFAYQIASGMVRIPLHALLPVFACKTRVGSGMVGSYSCYMAILAVFVRHELLPDMEHIPPPPSIQLCT